MKYTSFVLLAFCAFAVSALPTNVVPEEDFESPSQEPPNLPEKNPRQELTLLRKSVTRISKKIAIMETELEQKNAAPQVALVSSSTENCVFSKDTEGKSNNQNYKCQDSEMVKVGRSLTRCQCKAQCKTHPGGTYITAAGKNAGGGFTTARAPCYCLKTETCTPDTRGGSLVKTSMSVYTPKNTPPPSHTSMNLHAPQLHTPHLHAPHGLHTPPTTTTTTTCTYAQCCNSCPKNKCADRPSAPSPSARNLLFGGGPPPHLNPIGPINENEPDVAEAKARHKCCIHMRLACHW
jgi:hypothetical protein